MCKRIVFNIPKQVLERNYGKLISGSAKAKYNISPESKLVIKVEGEDFLTWSNWGLIPYNSKQVKDFEKLSCLDINDVKSVISKNSKRCIIPASGYFDWQDDNKPHLYQYPRNPHFAFAGICESWDIGNGKQIHSFAILTHLTGISNKDVPEFMPVTMNSQNSRNWLENEEINVYDTTAFIIDPQELSVSPASNEVIDTSINNPSLLKKGNSLSTGENYRLF